MQSQPDGRQLSALSLSALLVAAGLFVLPMVSQPVDAVAPTVANIWYWDTDCNGHVDAATFLFSMNMKDDSIRPSDFTFKHNYASGFNVDRAANGFITGLPPLTTVPTACSPSANMPPTGVTECPGGAGTADDRCFSLYFPEGIAPDTGARSQGSSAWTPPLATYTPDLAFQARGFTNAGDKLLTLGSCAGTVCKDASAPMLQAVYGTDNANFVIAVFSENIKAVAINNFCLTGEPSALASVAPVTGGLPNRAFRLTFSNVAPGDPPATPAEIDLDTLRIQVGPGCGTAMVDVADNTVRATTAPHMAAGAPRVTAVLANARDNEMVLQFSGPVNDGSQAIGTFSDRFSVSGGTSGLGISGGYHIDGGDRVVLLTGTTSPDECDILQTAGACTGGAFSGARIRLSGNAAFGFKSSVVTAATATDVNVQCQNPPAAGEPAQHYCLNDGPMATSFTSPRVKEYITRDTNNNGCLDAIQLNWNENMEDSGLAATQALWTVVYPSTLPTSATAPGGFDPVLRTSAIAHVTKDPTLAQTADNDAVTWLSIPEICTGAASNKYPFGNTGILPRISFCDGMLPDPDAGRANAVLCTATGTDLPRDRETPGNPMRAGSNGPLGFVYRAPTVDGAKPVVTSAQGQDGLGPNGYLDRMRLTFSEGIGATTFVHSAWTATVQTALEGCPLLVGTTYAITGADTVNANRVGTPTPTTGTTGGGDAQIDLQMTEKSGLNPAGDTGCVLDLTYSGSITEATDRFHKPTPTSIGQTMNSIVAGPNAIFGVAAGCADAPICSTTGVTPGSTGTIKDTATSPFGGVPVGANLAIVKGGTQTTHTVTEVTTTQITFTPGLATAAANGDRYSVNCPGLAFVGGSGPISRNVLCESDGGQPYVMNGRVDSVVDSNIAYITFSEPVFGSGATTIGANCGSPAQVVNGGLFSNGLLRPADFFYNDRSNGGVSGITAVNPVGDNCRKWQLTLSGPLTQGDVVAGLSGDCISPRVPVSDPATVEGVRDGMPSAPMPSPGNFPGIGNIAIANPACVPLTPGVSPVSSAETVDADHDGSLDAVKITFTTSVTDPFSTVLAGDADNGALKQDLAGYTLCRVAGAGTPADTDRIYADVGGTCGTVGDGDFRYSPYVGTTPAFSKQSGTFVSGGDEDATMATPFTALTTGVMLRVPGVGAGTTPHIRDNIYADLDAVPNGVDAGDFRYSGFDARFWGVKLNGVNQIVTGVVTVLPTTGGTHNNNFPPNGGPTGAPCHDSRRDPAETFLNSVASDAILFVCFEQAVDAAGKLVPNTGVAGTNLQVSYSGTTIFQVGGGTPGSAISVFVDQPTTDGAPPVLVTAIAGAGTKTIAATFSEPVERNAGGILTPSEFSYVNGNPGSPDCINGAASIASIGTYTAPTGTGPMTITLTTDGFLSVDDVATPPGPASTSPLGADVVAHGSHVDCTVSDSLRAIPSLVREITNTPTKLQVHNSAVTFTDDKAPTILNVGFIDANGDGIVDAAQVRFNEFISDGTLTGTPCGLSGGATRRIVDACINNWSVKAKRSDNTLQTLEILHVTTGQLGVTGELCQNTYSVTAGTGAVPAPLRLVPYTPGATGGETTPLPDYTVGVDDDVIFLCLNPDKVLANGGTKAAGTAITGELLYSANPVSARITDSFVGPIVGPNALADTPSGSPIAISDMARPAILNNCRANTFLDRTDGVGTIGTYDAATDPVCPSNVADEGVQTDDRNNDGRIDAMRIKFSEPVKDSTWQLAQWSLSGRAMTGMFTGAGATAANDDTIWLVVTPAGDSDADIGRLSSPAVPDVGYFTGGAMVDMAAVPNLLRGLAAGACTASQAGCADERDGAAPAVAQIAAQPGTNLVTIRFSEGVGTGPNGIGQITTADLSYVNSAAGGATSITAISHTAGSDTVTLTLNANLNAADVAQDKVAFTGGNIKEAYCGPGAPAGPRPLPTDTPPYLYPRAGVMNSCYRELALANSLKILSGASGSPPSAMELGHEDVTATGVTLTFEAPTDDDNDVVRYILSYCEGDSFFNDCTDFGDGDTVDVAATEESETVTGLTTGKTYTFVIQAEDALGNLGALSNEESVLIRAPDTDAPCAVDDLIVTQENPSTIKLSWTGPQGDCDAGDDADVEEYVMAVACGSGNSITAASFAGQVNDNVNFPLGAPNPGGIQVAEATGLSAGTPCKFAVKAKDAAGNLALISNVVEGTPNQEGNTIAGPVEDLEALPDSPATTRVKLIWIAPPADADLGVGKVSGYEVKQSTSESMAGATTLAMSSSLLTYTPSKTNLAGPSVQQQVVVSGLDPDTTYYFTVAALGGPVSEVVSITTAAGMSQARLNELQKEFSDTVKVTRSGDTNTVTWDTPPSADGTPAAGIQVWRLRDGEWTMVGEFDSGSRGFTEGFSEEGSADDQYKATVFYGPDESMGHANSSSDIANFDELNTATIPAGFLGLDLMWWIVIGAAVLLLLGLILFLALRGRKAPGDELSEEDEEGMESSEEFAAVDEADAAAPEGDMPEGEPTPYAGESAAAAGGAGAAMSDTQPAGTPDKHYLTCPKCATEFSAFGIKPLAIQCPNCGVRGTLR